MSRLRHNSYNSRLTLSVKEVADLLGVPQSTVRTWLSRSVLPSLRIGGRRLIKVSDLYAYLDRCEGGHGG